MSFASNKKSSQNYFILLRFYLFKNEFVTYEFVTYEFVNFKQSNNKYVFLFLSYKTTTISITAWSILFSAHSVDSQTTTLMNTQLHTNLTAFLLTLARFVLPFSISTSSV